MNQVNNAGKNPAVYLLLKKVYSELPSITCQMNFILDIASY